MSSKIEVDRETLQRWLDDMGAGRHEKAPSLVRKREELGALLAAPVVERQPVAWETLGFNEYGLECRKAVTETKPEVEQVWLLWGDRFTIKQNALYTAPPELAELQAKWKHAESGRQYQIELVHEQRREITELQATIAQQAAEIERLKGGQGEPVLFVAVESIEDPECVGMHATRSANELQCVALYTSQPAPVSVVLPDDWQDQLFAEMERRLKLRKHIDDNHMVFDDTQVGVEFAIEWLAACIDKVKELNQ